MLVFVVHSCVAPRVGGFFGITIPFLAPKRVPALTLDGILSTEAARGRKKSIC